MNKPEAVASRKRQTRMISIAGAIVAGILSIILVVAMFSEPSSTVRDARWQKTSKEIRDRAIDNALKQ